MRASSHGTDRITTALLLAAGTGSRLQPLTQDAPKCLTEVNGTTILERLVSNLRTMGFTRLIVVVGYLEGCIREALTRLAGDFKIEFISSPRYRTTNNIYSLWMARNTIREPFLLVESDLVFDDALLEGMLVPDRIAVSRILPWMNGTTVALGPFRQVTRFSWGALAQFGLGWYFGAHPGRDRDRHPSGGLACPFSSPAARARQSTAAARSRLWTAPGAFGARNVPWPCLRVPWPWSCAQG